MTDEKGTPGSPGIVSAAVTLVVACFALVTFARSHGWANEYPHFSLEDPARAIFQLAEYERRVAQAWPAGVPGFIGSPADAAAAWRDLGDEAYRAVTDGVVGADTVLESATIGAKVVAAGWGAPQAIAAVRAMPDVNMPSYLVKRVREIQKNEEAADRARAVSALRWHASASIVNVLGLGGALVSLVLLGWRRPWRSRPATASQPVTFGVGSAFVVLSWSFAALAVAWRTSWANVPLLGDLSRWFSWLFVAFVAIALVFDARTSGSPIALRSMLSLPSERAERVRWALLMTLAFGADLWFSWLVDYGFWSAGGHFPWRERVVEPLMYGSGFDAFAETLELVIFAPLAEEILFRGVLLGALLRRLSTHPAALISAIVFAVWHGYGIGGTLMVGFGGYLWALLYARTGSLLPGMLLHAAINAIVCLDAVGSRV